MGNSKAFLITPRAPGTSHPGGIFINNDKSLQGVDFAVVYGKMYQQFRHLYTSSTKYSLIFASEI